MDHLRMNFYQFVIIVDLWWPEVAIYSGLKSQDLENFGDFFCIFWKDNPLWENFQNFVLKEFITHGLTCCVQIL